MHLCVYDHGTMEAKDGIPEACLWQSFYIHNPQSTTCVLEKKKSSRAVIVVGAISGLRQSHVIPKKGKSFCSCSQLEQNQLGRTDCKLGLIEPMSRRDPSSQRFSSYLSVVSLSVCVSICLSLYLSLSISLSLSLIFCLHL